MSLEEQYKESFFAPMLKYVSEGATYEDLLAAGYTEEEIKSVFSDQPRGPFTISGPAGKPVTDTSLGTLDVYTPTARENFRKNLEAGLRAMDMPEGLVQQYANSVSGNENSMMPGIADLTPLGAAYSAQEGYRQVERGLNSGSNTDVALGALNTALSVVEAVPGGKAIGRGLSKVSEKLLEAYDPNVLGSNFGNLGAGATRISPRFLEESVKTGNAPLNIPYRNPILDVATAIDYPKKGIKGSDFLKILEKSPDVKNSRFSTIDLVDKSKFYTKEELLSELEKNSWTGTFRKLGKSEYETYQRQDFEEYDPSTAAYAEFNFAANRGDPSLPTFRTPDKFPQYHYPEDVLAHTRATVYENRRTGDKELVVEELQSDYVQQGWAKPSKAPTTEDLVEETFNRFKDSMKRWEVDPSFLSDEEVVGAIKDKLANSINSLKSPKENFEDKMSNSTFNAKLKALGLSRDDIDLVQIYLSDKPYEVFYESPLFDTVKPPIQKIKDTVEVSLDGLLAQAQYSDIDKIYVPSLEQIVSKRFKPGSFEFFMATRPGQGFHETYVNSLQEVLKDLKTETGLKYSSETRTPVTSPFYKGLGENEVAIFDELTKNAKLYSDWRSDKITSESFQKSTGATPEEFRQSFAKEVKSADRNPQNWLKTFQSYVYEDLVDAFGEELSLNNVGTLIDISGVKGKINFTRPRFAEGGMVEDIQMRRLLQEGGMTDDGMEVEPVTGNEVPPGSLASEVRDDIPAQLSEGEYVVPADVVRFFGVKFFEDLRTQAKQGLAEMDSQGRIGGTKVDASGVPVEDELTPEEEQMLMEALGASGQGQAMGMAEGGDVGGFDRTQFQLGGGSAIQSLKYINPTTKEIRYFQFAGTVPLGLIPEGFVPWTAELEQQTKEEPETAPTKEETSTRTNRPANTVEVKSSGEAGTGYESWAEKNYESIMNDPYQFGINALNDTSGQLLAKGAGVLGLATGAAPIALIGSAIKMGNKIQNIAEANAALKVMESQGLAGTTQYKNLEAEIRKASSDVPVTQLGLVGTGQNMYEAVVKKQSSGLTETTEPAKSSGTTAGTPAPAPTTATSKSSSGKVSGSELLAADAIAATKARAEAAAKLPNNFVATPSNNTIGGGTKYAGAYTSNLGNTVDKTATEDRRAVGGLMSKKKYKAPNKGLAGK